jgi:hypothetical protein
MKGKRKYKDSVQSPDGASAVACAALDFCLKCFAGGEAFERLAGREGPMGPMGQLRGPWYVVSVQ